MAIYRWINFCFFFHCTWNFVIFVFLWGEQNIIGNISGNLGCWRNEKQSVRLLRCNLEMCFVMLFISNIFLYPRSNSTLLGFWMGFRDFIWLKWLVKKLHRATKWKITVLFYADMLSHFSQLKHIKCLWTQ